MICKEQVKLQILNILNCSGMVSLLRKLNRSPMKQCQPKCDLSG